MSDYSRTIELNCPAEEVFTFVKDPRNMPQYLPTVHDARPQGEGRVEVAGDAAGHDYRSDGWFDIDDQSRSMRWGSDGENKYSGSLEVEEMGDRCRVTVNLRFEPRPDQDQAFQEQTGSRDATINDGLQAALESIRNICEGQGGKVPSQADQKGSSYLG